MKILRVYLTVLLLLSILVAKSQTVSKADIIGKWKTTAIKSNGKMSADEFKGIKDIFNSSIFEFLENGTCKINLITSNSEFKSMLAKNKWKYDSATNRLKIGNQADKYSIMGIIIEKSKTKTYFNLLESNIMLEVEKQ